MKGFKKKSAAMVLLCISIAASRMCPVHAEGTGFGNTPGTAYFVENDTVSGGDAADSGSDAIGKDGDWNTDGSITRTGAEDEDGSAGTDAEDKDDSTAGTDGKDTDSSATAEIEGDAETEKASAGGNQKDSGTVSGRDAADSGSNAVGAEGGTVSGGDADEPDSSRERQEHEGADADDGSGADMAGLDGESEKAGENGEGGEESIVPYDLTVYPDDRLMQWNMGNSSGKYGNSCDSYAVFDDNVIAALYGLGNDTYRLELTGTGEMAGPGGYDYQPYRAYRNKIISVTVGDGITNVGQKVFSRFSNLKEYTLPSSVKTIGEYAFEYCTSLESVVIPDTVDSISNYSFYHCEGATSLTVPGDLDYNGLYIPFYNMKNLKDIYITPGKTGAASVSQVTSPTGSPANISDGYTIHFMEGVTEIHDKIFANTKASRIEIADSVTVIGADAFAKKAYDTSTIPDYIVLGDNTRSIAFKAFMASVQTITPTTVEIGNVYQYEYDWAAVRREVTFVVRLNALKELTGMVEKDITDGILSQTGYPAVKWEELQDELAAAKGFVEEGSSDLNLVTGSFVRLYDLYHYEITADFIVTVPAEVALTEDAENNRVIGTIPVTVEYLHQIDNFSMGIEESSFVMQDKLSGKTLALEHWWEDLPWEGAGSGISSNLWLKGERLAGDWEGTVRLIFTCEE